MDTLKGGAGNDIISGAGDADIIQGGAGDDDITGGAGNDSLTGNAGNDTFRANSGVDTITDLSTGDILIVSGSATANATNIAAFVATNSTTNGGTANLSGANTSITIDMTLSASGAYTITGGTGSDTLKGGTGADTIIGGIGNDCLLYTSPSPRD